MDDKNEHIDKWLKDAAQQPVPDDTGMEAKQQAWSKLAALMDEAGKNDAPPQRQFWYRFSRAAVLIPLTVATTVVAMTVYLAIHHHHKKQSPLPEQQHRHKSGQPKTADTPYTYMQQAPQQTPADTTSGSAGNTAGLPNEGTSPALSPAEGGSNPAQPGTTPGYTPGATGREIPPATGTADTTSGTTGKGKNALHNKVNTATPTGGHRDNEPVAAGQTNTDIRKRKASATNKAASGVDNDPVAAVQTPTGTRKRKVTAADKAVSGDNERVAGDKNTPPVRESKTSTADKTASRDDNEAIASLPTTTPKRLQTANNPTTKDTRAFTDVLHRLPVRNVFALQLPSLSSGSRDLHISGGLGSSGLSMGAGDQRWALQAGLLSSLGSAYGVRVGVLYVYPFNDNWYLQSQLSAGYMTGYDKPFTHLAVNRQRVDSTGSSSGPANWDIDSTTTTYTFKSAFTGSAGINAGYRKNKIAVSTGLVFSYALPSGRKDSPDVRSRSVYDSTGTVQPSTTPAFSAGRLPGKQQLSLNIDFSYYLLPRLQAGINYRIVLLKSNGGPGFIAPVHAIQDNSMLELYIRIPIGK